MQQRALNSTCQAEQAKPAVHCTGSSVPQLVVPHPGSSVARMSLTARLNSRTAALASGLPRSFASPAATSKQRIGLHAKLAGQAVKRAKLHTMAAGCKVREFCAPRWSASCSCLNLGSVSYATRRSAGAGQPLQTSAMSFHSLGYFN